jgi:hypothetical protein
MLAVDGLQPARPVAEIALMPYVQRSVIDIVG